MASSRRDEYDVGFCKPPEHTRFKKGQSGNPKGRPKSKKSKHTDISSVLAEPVRAKLGKKDQNLSPFEASVRKLAEKALRGDLAAIIGFIKLCEEYDVIAPPPAVTSGPVVVVPKEMTSEEWLAKYTKPKPIDDE